MKKLIVILVSALVSSFISAKVCADEKITLSTYYPAPYGEYRTLSVGDNYTAPDPATLTDLVVEGNVGIGTNNPTNNLHIKGRLGEDVSLKLQTDMDYSAVGSKISRIDLNSTYGSGGPGIENTRCVIENQPYGNSTGDLVFYTSRFRLTETPNYRFSEKMRLTSTGRLIVDEPAYTYSNESNKARLAVLNGMVGIGTEMPQADLCVSNAAAPSIALEWTNNTGYGKLIFRENAVNKATIQTIGSNFAITDRQNDIEIGYNTSGDISFWPGQFATPTVTFAKTWPNHVLIATADTTATALNINNTSTLGTNWRLQSVGSDIAGRTGNFEIFNANTSTLGLVITNTGNVGIGDLTPTSAGLTIRRTGGPSGTNTNLRLENSVNDSSGTGGAGFISIAGNNGEVVTTAIAGDMVIRGPAYHAIIFSINELEKMRIMSDGLVSIETLKVGSPGDAPVYVNSGGILFRLPSDIRLKKNIETISDKIDVINSLKQLRGVYFNWNTDMERVKDLGSQREVGMIAQDVEKVLPELVGTDKDGYKTLDHSKLVAFLIEVNKAQQEQIDALEQRIAELEKK